MSRAALELELDLDAFAGPFDLLLALVLREEVELVDVPIVEIVLRYVDRLDEVHEEIDLESLSEFLVLVAALCELKARLLVAGDEEVDELDPEAAANELAERLTEYRRFRSAAAGLGEMRAALGRRVVRLGPAPLAPRRPPAEVLPESPAALAQAMARLLTPPEPLDAGIFRFRHVSVRPFLERFRRALAERGAFVFDDEVRDLGRPEQAAAFLALLDLYKRGEARIDQAGLFEPIRVKRRSPRHLQAVPDEAVA